MACGECFTRAFIGIINGVILITAIALGIVFFAMKGKDKYNAYFQLIKGCPPFAYALSLLIILALSSIFGFFLICCRNKCWRRSYFVLLLIVLILEIVAVILVYTQKDKILNNDLTRLRKSTKFEAV